MYMKAELRKTSHFTLARLQQCQMSNEDLSAEAKSWCMQRRGLQCCRLCVSSLPWGRTSAGSYSISQPQFPHLRKEDKSFTPQTLPCSSHGKIHQREEEKVIPVAGRLGTVTGSHPSHCDAGIPVAGLQVELPWMNMALRKDFKISPLCFFLPTKIFSPNRCNLSRMVSE
ncbi:hypothetical protein Y1Q_0021308 [Alligator mississippiensis]|uniref:Uncharacterized protein n=1 Tax=Alligator mississippiensis TaxID=8496 RepID=A0A151P9A5_ALLMI|nr:hypothetical protein Y1Q_0021308 [Alligator mississippiensis]